MKTKLGLNIVDFFELDWILNDKELSPIQKVILKSIMGDPLDIETPIIKEHPYQTKDYKNEVEMYLDFTGKTEYETSFHSDVDLCLGRRSGKTQVKGSIIQLADGSVRVVDELIGQKIDIISWDKATGNYVNATANVVDNGIKPCSLIKTKYGHLLERTDNHPLLTINGWASVDASYSPDVGELLPLKVGDRIAVPINNPIQGSKAQDESLIKLLAYILADGSCANKHVSYTLYNKVQKEEILSLLDGTYSICPKSGTEALDLKINTNNSIYSLLKDLNLLNKKSDEKFIPNWVYRLPNKQVALFLNRLISTDGWACVSNNTKAEIGFSSSSKNITYGVKRLLSRLGIVSNIHKSKAGYKRNGVYKKCKDRYSLIIENNSEIIKFLERVGLFGKDQSIKAVADVLKANSYNCQIDSMPLDFCYKFAMKLSSIISYTRQEKEYWGRIRPDRCASKSRLLKYANEFPNQFKEELKLLNLDFYWDEIVAIETMGDQPTAGLEVPIYHTYINDVLEHNSTKLGAGLALYFATQFDYSPYLRTSPHATIPIISPTKEQAGEVYASIKQMILRSPYLYNKFLGGRLEGFEAEYSEEGLNPGKLTGGKISFNNKVIIKVMAADVSKMRGMAVPFAILDEACWFGVEGNDQKNTDKGIYEALAPALSQFQEIEGMAMILKISSPNGQSGLMFSDYENRKDPDVLHFQVPTWWANPKISVSYLEKQKKKGMNFFNREYGAMYTASETAYLDPTLIDESVIRGTEELDYQKGYRYVAAMDYATKDDYWAFAIGHKEYVTDPDSKEKEERVYIDFIRFWRGSSGNELNPAEIAAEIAMYMKRYKVQHCITDQYAFAPLRSLFRQEKAVLKEFKVAAQSKLKYMYSLQVLINSKRLRLVNVPLAVRHLKDLREKRTSGNRLKVEHASHTHDDLADAIGLVAYQFDKSSPIYVGTHKEEEVVKKTTKDAKGNHLAYPLAEELAERVGISNKFFDNRDELEAKKKEKEEGEDPDDGGEFFWF